MSRSCHKPTPAPTYLLSLVALLSLIALLSPAPAQVPPISRPPFGPNVPGPPDRPGLPGGVPGIGNPPNSNPRGLPPLGVPEFVSTCSKCGAELGRGPSRPSVDKCPHCGVHFINGMAPRNNPFNPPQQPPPLSQPDRSVPPSQFRPPLSIQQTGDGLAGRSDPANEIPSGDASFTFAVAMGIGTILVGVIILVVLGIVMMANSGNGAKRRRTLHYPEDRYF